MVKYLVKKVTQFPSDQECYHYIQSIKDKDPELRMRCAQCVETIITAKERQEKKANEHADELLREIEEEKINLRNKKKSKTKQKKKTKPENESGEIEPGQAEPEPVAPVVQQPVPEPAEIKTPQTKNRKNKKTNRLEETSTNESKKPDNSTSPTSFASEPARVPVINDEDPADKALRAQMEQIKLEHPEKVEPTSIAAKRTAKDAKRKEKETKRNSKTPNETLEFVNSNIPTSVGGALATQAAAAVAAQVAIQEEQPDWNVVKNKKPIRKLVLPSNQIARVIGRSGCNVNAIRDVTGTHIGNGCKYPQ